VGPQLPFHPAAHSNSAGSSSPKAAAVPAEDLAPPDGASPSKPSQEHLQGCGGGGGGLATLTPRPHPPPPRGGGGGGGGDRLGEGSGPTHGLNPRDFTSFAASTSMTFLTAEPLRSKAALLNAVKETPAELARPPREKPFSGSPRTAPPGQPQRPPPAHHPNPQHPNEPRNDYRCGLECRAPSGQPCWTPPSSPRLAGRTLPPVASVELHPQTACLPAQAAVT
jgi:hypothetical protein